MTMPVRLDDYDARQRDALVALWRRSFEHGVGLVDPHSIDDQRAYFEHEVVPNHRVRVATLDGELVGFMASTPESIAQLYVAVAHLRRGIGSRFVERAKAECSGRLWLHTFVRNLGARAFYERHGFVDRGHGFENMWKLEDIRYEWVRGGT